MEIKVLSDQLINKIAAGEVIERPSSVVKELLENSLDANATIINIDIHDGGKSSIKINDNGKGINKEDIPNSVIRHATSKILTDDDLFNIKTLGFRGEALASIATVSKLKIITKGVDGVGTKVLFDQGQLIKEEDISCDRGTTIEVRDLFYNTPVRLKYLKTKTTELSRITDIITRYGLITNSKITYKSDDKEILSKPLTSDLLENIGYILGVETSKEMIKVDKSSTYFKLTGYVSKPSLTKSDKSAQFFYINSRFIKSNVISNALHDAFHTLLHLNRYPVAVLNIIVDPNLIDVNVHPTKIEVRLEKESELYELVFEAIKETLQSTQLIPDIIDDTTQLILASLKEKRKEQIKQNTLRQGTQKTLSTINTVVKESSKIPELRVLGQVLNCYILAEVKDGFIIVDQHVAEERVNYERLMTQYERKGIGKQELIDPILIELSLSDKQLVMEKIDLFLDLSFEIEDFGNNLIIIKSMPTILGRNQNKDFFLDLIDDIKKGKNTLDDTKERILTKMSCVASVKQGKKLELFEMQKIIENLQNAKDPYTCPHGRPIIIKMSKEQLEKQFKRV